MSNYVRGTKRLQIFQRWLQGIDDPDFEVFPTKVEGKYIVKKRTEPLPEPNKEHVIDNTTDNTTYNTNEQVDEQTNKEPSEQTYEEPTEQTKPTQSKKTVTKPKPLPTVPKRIRERHISPEDRRSDSNPADLTVSYEILNQLKELGNELKQQRIKKEQKSMIKQVVQKQMTKRPRKQILKEESDDYEYEYYDEPSPSPSARAQHKRTDSIIEQPQPSSLQQIFKSRIRR